MSSACAVKGLRWARKCCVDTGDCTCRGPSLGQRRRLGHRRQSQERQRRRQAAPGRHRHTAGQRRPGRRRRPARHACLSVNAPRPAGGRRRLAAVARAAPAQVGEGDPRVSAVTRVNAALPGPTQTFHCARRGNLTQHFWPNADLSPRTPGFSRPRAKTPRTPHGTLPGTRCRERICCARRGNAALRPKRRIDTSDCTVGCCFEDPVTRLTTRR